MKIYKIKFRDIYYTKRSFFFKPNLIKWNFVYNFSYLIIFYHTLHKFLFYMHKIDNSGIRIDEFFVYRFWEEIKKKQNYLELEGKS